MLSVYKVVLQNGKALSAADFPKGLVVSIKRVGDGIAQVVVEAEREHAENLLRGLKESICLFQRVDIEQAGRTQVPSHQQRKDVK
jgi:hypothetical protein